MHCSFCKRSFLDIGLLNGTGDGTNGSSIHICRDCAAFAIEVIDRARNEHIANSLPGLSHRELAVFNAIGLGLTSRQIAIRLGIAVSTVETYRERLKDKLKLHSGNELMRSAIIWFEKQATAEDHSLKPAQP